MVLQDRIGFHRFEECVGNLDSTLPGSRGLERSSYPLEF